uniref:Uncharacterized protein n=1 Tax=Opuntia streptacantha TaxID=393608 RepID=A0A7C9CNR1_OPUST
MHRSAYSYSSRTQMIQPSFPTEKPASSFSGPYDDPIRRPACSIRKENDCKTINIHETGITTKVDYMRKNYLKKKRKRNWGSKGKSEDYTNQYMGNPCLRAYKPANLNRWRLPCFLKKSSRE